MCRNDYRRPRPKVMLTITPNEMHACGIMTLPYSAIDGSWPDVVAVGALLSVARDRLRRYPHCEEDTRVQNRSGSFCRGALEALSIRRAIQPRGNWQFNETSHSIALIIGHICRLGFCIQQLFWVKSELYRGLTF